MMTITITQRTMDALAARSLEDGALRFHPFARPSGPGYWVIDVDDDVYDALLMEWSEDERLDDVIYRKLHEAL